MQLPGCSQRHAHEDGASTASMTVTNAFLRFFNPYHSQSLRSRCAAETESKRHSLITSKPDKQESQSGRELRTAYAIRWDENAGLRRDAIRSQVIDALEAQGDKGDR